jgi:hypothetical protein
MPDTNPFLYEANRRMLPQGTAGPILAWIKEAVAEGEGIMQADPVWNEIDLNQDYITGKQKARAVTQDRPAYVAHTVVNETRRTHRRHVSALTDVKPTYAFKTPNPNFQTQALLLNNLTAVWWINTFADLAFADAASYAIAGGSGDLVCEYNPFYGPMGDVVLYPRDARDTIPIRPSRSGSIQSWFGVILREAHSYNVLAATYPDKIGLIRQSASPWGGGIFTKIRQGMNRILGGGATSTLSGLTKAYTANQTISGNEIILYKVFLSDPSINTTRESVFMGTPGTNWGYAVKPGERLYPRKRLIVATEAGVLYDGPNPYWHGMFPVARLKLVSVPWSYFGLPLIDVQVQSGLADATNDLLNAMLDNIRQKNRPPMIGNSRVPEPMLRMFDPLNPRARMRTNEQVGTGVQPIELPDLPPFTLELWTMLRQAQHDLTGDSTLDALQGGCGQPEFRSRVHRSLDERLEPELKLEGRQRRTLHPRDRGDAEGEYFPVVRPEAPDAGAGRRWVDAGGFRLRPGKSDSRRCSQAPRGTCPHWTPTMDQRDRAQFFLKLFTFYVTQIQLWR